jgi:hypothetical protein
MTPRFGRVFHWRFAFSAKICMTRMKGTHPGESITTDQKIALFTATLTFISLIFVGFQLRDGTRQQRSQSLMEIYGMNRELISLGFADPVLFRVMADAKDSPPDFERRYLQLWFDHFALINAYLRESLLKGEMRDALLKDLSGLLKLKNAQRFWQEHGTSFPPSFQTLVNELLKKGEPPPRTAHHAKRVLHDANT